MEPVGINGLVFLIVCSLGNGISQGRAEVMIMDTTDYLLFASQLFGCYVIGYGTGFLINFVKTLMEKI